MSQENAVLELPSEEKAPELSRGENSPENKNAEQFKLIAESFSRISKELARRATSGYVVLFSPDSAKKFTKIVSSFENISAEDLEMIFKNLNTEVMQLGNYFKGGGKEDFESMKIIYENFDNIRKRLDKIKEENKIVTSIINKCDAVCASVKRIMNELPRKT